MTCAIVLAWLSYSFRYWHGSLLLAIVLAWLLSWLGSRLCLARGMALVLAWLLSSLSFQLRVKLDMALVFTLPKKLGMARVFA